MTKGVKVDGVVNFSWIGIDLGTTHSAAACVLNGMSGNIEGVKADMIPINLEQGNPILPSVAKIQDNGDPPFVGNTALRKQYPWPLMTLYDAKRIFGMKFSDSEIVNNMRVWTFDLVGDEDNKPFY